MSKRCPKVSCPVIRVHCTPRQKAKNKCYVVAGKKKYNTKDSGATGSKVTSLVNAQRKHRCVPLVKTTGSTRRPASAMSKAHLKAEIKKVNAEAKSKRDNLRKIYKTKARPGYY